ncbi:hypothetical protein [Chamaesiphon minutus]|uniref:Uncharacterized protein n=1 Tax=Chamaesiphon minutus (strain ATCC 27169 / PCC 6605) TaxID=1173020 RepID=K9UR67_CHAP6|nr:hypothetical protein [Chamaesiphon minutus]AFY97178.1 hypothetical protein Cha6605_6356 [Chamaesiphon minutus PCC 6605]
MHSLFLRFIVLVSAGILIYEMIKGEFNLILETSNFMDLIIIIIAMCGLFLGISIPETPISDSASTDAVTSLAKVAPPAQTRTDEESKNEDN